MVRTSVPGGSGARVCSGTSRPGEHLGMGCSDTTLARLCESGGICFQADYRAYRYFPFSPRRATHFSLFAQRKVSKRKRPPTSGPACGGVPSFRCRFGGRQQGPSLSRRSSLGVLPRVPLHDTSTRPSDGDYGSELSEGFLSLFRMFPSYATIRQSNCPLQEAEWRCTRKGASRRDAARGAMGQGWPVACGPPKGRRSEGNLAAGGAGCRGQAFCLLSTGPAIRRLESRSPGGAKQEVSTCSVNG